ncbi:MAG: Hsp20/alpha crystallin family protein [Candidatus Micrarchaeota archaeon]|nr:Hsp20/alpha crystallin family protein [Candidatus Micrarchaeota archaeon]
MEGTDLWSRMRRMQEEMDRIFGDFFTEPRPALLLPSPDSKSKEGELALSRASADLYETDKEIVAKFDLPGAEKSDINVEIEDGSLRVKVEKTSERSEKKKGAYISERAYSGYFRCIPLPNYAKTENATAEYRNGVLVVKMPKDEKKTQKVKRLQVK